jgi:phage terminase large subunit
MKFTVFSEGKATVYEGCEPARSKTTGVKFVAIVWFEGELDVWYLDDERKAVESMKRYYADQYGPACSFNFTIYKK